MMPQSWMNRIRMREADGVSITADEKLIWVSFIEACGLREAVQNIGPINQGVDADFEDLFAPEETNQVEMN